MRLYTTIYLLFFILISSFGGISESIKSPFTSLGHFRFFRIENVQLQIANVKDHDSLSIDACQNTYKDSLIKKRIQEIDAFYDGLSAKKVLTTRSLFEKYAPNVRNYLRIEKLPSCYQLLPIVLSAMNPYYTSERNTKGIWQLSYPVAVRFGLKLNSEIDERLNPELSSKAVAKYFVFLREKYKSDELAILAFLNSPSDLNYAIKKTNSDTFEDLYYYLSPDTRDFYLAYQVMNYKFIDLERRVVGESVGNKAIKVDTLVLEKNLLTSIFLKYTKTDTAALSFLNPTFVGSYIPKANLGYSLLVPYEVKQLFETIKDSIYKEQKKYLSPPKPKPITPPAHSKITFYTVKSGDVLGSISRRFGVRVSKLKYWNRLSSDRINVGQKLKVYVDEKAYPAYKPKPVVTSTKEPSSGKIVVYTVKSGDNLWVISKQYSGVSPEDIMELNNIDENIDVGQKIKIKVP